ncbi:MAG: hypothetical protein EOO57_10820 [Hymenobacter sp.]|nr:MAG: hypothetical protein EOO57_10820 [Hymenobacter sp.]
MKNFNSLICCAFLVAAAAGCKSKATAPACPDVLAGTWHLTSRSCACAPTPMQDETIILADNQEYSVLRDGLLTTKGTYAISQGAACGGGSAVPFLTFTPAAPGGYAPNGTYTLRDCTLVIDQCQTADRTVLAYGHPVD